MNTKQLTFLCLFLSQVAFSQYTPFPETTAHWSMRTSDGSIPGDQPADDFGYYYEINGDTLINGINYKKVFESSATWVISHYDIWDPYYGAPVWIPYSWNNDTVTTKLIGALREDIPLKKVYFRQLLPDWMDSCVYMEENSTLLNEDVLLFDFDAEEGDTIYLGGMQRPFVINVIDSVQYNDGITRKVFYPINQGFYESFIEGLGTRNGLFNHFSVEIVEGTFCYLSCFQVEEEYVIGEGIYNCDSIDVVERPINDLVVNLGGTEITFRTYPSPFSDNITIDLESNTANNLGGFKISLYNQLGQWISDNTAFTNTPLSINTTELAVGFYYISIFKENKLLATEKVMKVKQ